MILAVLDQWIALAKQWQPLLAGLLGLSAAIILAAAVLRAAKIHAIGYSGQQRGGTRDLRIAAEQDSIDHETVEDTKRHLERLRSLLRSALSALSSTDADSEAARMLCSRVASFQWKHFPLPVNADKRLRETYATFLNQFELLEMALGKEWSPLEVSAILIQLNANARAISAIFKTLQPGEAETLDHQNQN
jgi:hypothetical protein